MDGWVDGWVNLGTSLAVERVLNMLKNMWPNSASKRQSIERDSKGRAYKKRSFRTVFFKPLGILKYLPTLTTVGLNRN